MKEKYKEIIVIIFFIFLTLFAFRNYFFKGAVPFPSNLLASFYQPWASYKFEGYPNGPPSKPMGFDNLRIFYPLRKLTIDQIKNLEWPLWNPYNFSGNTHLGTYQSAVFHPLSFLFFILPQIDAWSLIIILQPFLSGIFMYYFLKEINLTRKSSVFGALTFAFAGFMVVWWEESFMSSYSALFLPLILYSIEKLFKRISIFDFLLLTLSLTFSLLSGWFQMSFYVFILSIAWIVYRLLKSNKKREKVVFFITSYVLSFMISAIHLIPAFESFMYSARGTTDAKFIFDMYLMPFSHLITFFIPDFFGNPAVFNYFGGRSFYHEKVIYVGIVALIFAVYELVHLRKNSYKEKFFKFVFIITLSLGFSLPTSWFLLYNLKIPLISVILPSRIFFLSTFCISVLAAFGLERYLASKKDKSIFLILSLIGLFFVGIWAFIIYSKIIEPSNNFSTVSFRNSILPSAFYIICVLLFIVLSVKKSLKNKLFIVILGIAVFSSIYFVNKYLYFSERKFIFPKTPVISALKDKTSIDRFWGVGNAYMDRNFATYFGLFSPEGYDSFYIGRYGELLYSAQNKGKFSNQIPRTDATLSGIGKLEELYNDPYRSKMLSLLGVRYIVAENKTGIKSQTFKLNKIWNDDKFVIYENKSALPRFFLTDSYKVTSNSQKILDEIYSNTDLSKTVILEEKPPIDLNKEQLKGKAKLISYTPNKIRISTKLNKTALLFVSDNFYPGWKAYVDSNETKIYRADYSFRAVVVPGGNHIVSFKYEPASFYIGVIIALFGLLATLIVCITIRYISYKKT